MTGYDFEKIQANAKEAADEMINTMHDLLMARPDTDGYILGLINFYKQVKIEIDNL